jgi:glycine/D-amino acid oxidase-like deaminating enzyme
VDLHTNYPYSLIRHGIINTFPSLDRNVSTDVVIAGAGVSGALAAWYLVQKGINCMVVDKRHAGMGSTAASTSLIQYEIDTPLHQLIKKAGYKNAVTSYHLCRQAVYDLQQVCEELNNRKLFESKCSLQYASYKKDVNQLKEEYKVRKENGFELDFFTAEEVTNCFGLQAPAAILTKEAAQLDAYVFTHEILKKVQNNCCPIFDHTEIISIKHNRRNVVLTAASNYTITARKLVIACGYESQQYLTKKIEKLKCTYAIVSEVFNLQEFWYRNCLIWETAQPYLYIRTTNDNRIIVGGKDTKYLPAERQRLMLRNKSAALKESFQQLFPHLSFKTDFQWSGAFGNTTDGLPYIGSVPEHPDTFFALGYGGNGITFSIVAAQMIAEAISGKKPPGLSVFSFTR